MKRLIPRKFERKRLIGRATIRLLPEGPAMLAQVLDFGQSGIAAFVEYGLLQGTLVEVAFTVKHSLPLEGSRQRDARVVRSRAYSEGNIVGIEFLRPLADVELKDLEANWVRS